MHPLLLLRGAVVSERAAYRVRRCGALGRGTEESPPWPWTEYLLLPLSDSLADDTH